MSAVLDPLIGALEANDMELEIRVLREGAGPIRDDDLIRLVVSRGGRSLYDEIVEAPALPLALSFVSAIVGGGVIA